MKENKTLIIVAIIIIVLLVGLCIFIGKDKNNSSNLSNDPETIMGNLQAESAAIKDEDKGEFGAYINVSEYMDLYNKEGEYSLVWVARPTCSYCELTTPVLQKIIKDHSIYISYLNTDEFSEEDLSTFLSTSEDFSEGYGTPMLLLVGDGQILDMIDGATDTDHYTAFLKDYKFIKE